MYILIFGIKKFFENFKRCPYDFAHLSNFQLNPNLKNEQNHKGDPLNWGDFGLGGFWTGGILSLGGFWMGGLWWGDYG